MNPHKYLLFILLLCILVAPLHSQTIVFQRDSSEYFPPTTTFGRNRTNWVFPQFQILWPVGPQATGAKLQTISSLNFRIGVYYKRKFTNWFSVGAGISYSNERLQLKQSIEKTLPDTVLHDREWFKLHGLLVGIFFRFNLDAHKRNKYGFYIETGGDINYIFSFIHVAKERNEVTNTITEVRKVNPDYALPVYGDVFLKVGWKNLALVFNYRFSPITKLKFDFPNPSPIRVGLELNI